MDIYWIASRIDRVKTPAIKTLIKRVKQDASGELLKDLEAALLILELPLDMQIKALLEAELPGLELPE